MSEFTGNKHALLFITVCAMIIIGLVCIKVVLTILTKALDRSNLDPVLHDFIINIVKVLCLVILILTVLGKIGVPTSTFVTVLAACGAAVALALQESLGNFAGGILILLSKPFSRGDLIKSNDVEGRVQSINLLYSTLRTDDNEMISIPNGQLANNTIINYSSEDRRRVSVNVGISYSADIETAREKIKEAVSASENFLSDTEAFIGVSGLDDSSVELVVIAWCRTDFYLKAGYELREIIKEALDGAGVEIPYPQIVVHRGESA